MNQSAENVSRLGIIAQNASRVANVWINCHLRRPPKYLPILVIFITDKCNLKCGMCGVWEQYESIGDAGELSTEEWKAVIRSAAKLRTALITITGGEPLLRPDLFDIIKYTREIGIAVHLSSNGTILNHHNIDQLRESGVNSISISVDSHIPNIHNSLRGQGTFEKAVEGIRLLHQRAPSIKIGINYLITAKNFRNMSEMIPLAEGLGVHQIKFAPIHTNLQHRGKRFEKFGNLIFKDKDLDELEFEVKKLMRAASGSSLQTTSAMFFAGITSLYRRPRKFRCYAGYAACAINPPGMVAPCCDMEGILCVRDKPLDEIWRSNEFQKLRHRVRHCDRPCWDTTNAELSLRLRMRALFGEISQTWQDLNFYFS